LDASAAPSYSPAAVSPTKESNPVPEGYEVLEVLGQGGTGTVYLAQEKATKRELALKMLPLEVDETRRARFEVEANVGTMLKHPDIIEVYGCGTVEGMGWIAMERLRGQELAALRHDSSLSLERRVEIVVRMALALHHAHGHEIVHRDVKPSNIFLGEDGGVKLLDFGIARLKANKITKTGYIVGTPQYMSPEQISGVAIDPRADVFSLGVVAYELLAGQLPWMGENHTQIMMAICSKPPKSFRNTVDKARFGLSDAEVAMLHSIVHKAIRQEPRHRYANAEDMASAFQAFLDRSEETLAEIPTDGVEELDPEIWMKRRMGWAAARAARVKVEESLDGKLPAAISSPSLPATSSPMADDEDEVRESPNILWAVLIGVFVAGLGLVIWLAMAEG